MTHCSPRTTTHIIAGLRAEVSRLRAELAAARLLSANRVAALHAALNAARDGESDPLIYLREQLADEATPATWPGRG